jgi:23S rRNA pseudouridine2605 synthase
MSKKSNKENPPRSHADGETPDLPRLQKYLAHAGIASRRHAEELIATGAVTVNGQVIRKLGTRVNAATDEVRVFGEPVRPISAFLYVMLNKPAGTVSTVSDPFGRRTVLDLLPEDWRRQRIYPVGRLDFDTEGLLLLTNDGELALHLTHPRYALAKVYQALVADEPAISALRQLEQGILLVGESRPTAPARLRILKRQGDACWISIEIHEGRNRQVRRMLESIGYPPLRLRRVAVGPLDLGHLASGDYRQLTPKEVSALYQASGPENRESMEHSERHGQVNI